MSKRTSLVASTMILLSMLLAGGCVHEWGTTIVGSGTTKTQSYDVPSFSAVRLDLSTSTEITIGPRTEVSIEADDNLLPVIHAAVDGDTLVISSDQSISTSKGIKVSIKTPNLKALSIDGSSKVVIHDVSEDRLKVSISGSGSVKVSGKVAQFDGNISGSGDFALSDLSATDVTIGISGSGRATVNATQSLKASISGSGNVRYQSNPGLKVNTSVSGSGSVESL